MIEMHSKYDNMHINGMFYALFCINNHVLSCLDFISSLHQPVDPLGQKGHVGVLKMTYA